MPTAPKKSSFATRVNEARLKRLAMYEENDDRRRCTLFWSNASEESGNWLLSNFAGTKFVMTWPNRNESACADAVRIPSWLCGRVCAYDTSENAYQALLAGNLESAKMFESGGIVSMDIFRAWPAVTRTGLVREDVYDKKMKQWGEKGPGIAAKMVSNLDTPIARAAFGMALLKPKDESGIAARRKKLLETGPSPENPDKVKTGFAALPGDAAFVLDREKLRRYREKLAAIRDRRDAADAEFERRMQERMETVELGVWGSILRAKFSQNEDARFVLMGTLGDILVERSRMPRQGDYWSAFLENDGRRIGGNMMGRLLMRIRSELQRTAAAAAAALPSPR
jgi:hypothetical protein